MVHMGAPIDEDESREPTREATLWRSEDRPSENLSDEEIEEALREVAERTRRSDAEPVVED